jgi:hypothetical protein
MKEVRRAVRESDEADDLGIAAQRHGCSGRTHGAKCMKEVQPRRSK